MSFNDEILQERIKKVESFLNNQIAQNIQMLFFMMPFLLIISICFIYLTWFNFWTVLIIVFVIFCILAIIETINDSLNKKKQLKLIYTDTSVLEEVETLMKNKNDTAKDKIEALVRVNMQDNNGILYSVILQNAYGCKFDVIKYLREKFLISLSEAKEFVDKMPIIIVESVDLDKASQIQKDLIALGAGCVIEEYNPNRTSSEIKDKYTDNLLHCPRCGSTSVAIGQRGWKITTGFIGSSKTTNRCGNCGHTWQPK